MNITINGTAFVINPYLWGALLLFVIAIIIGFVAIIKYRETSQKNVYIGIMVSSAMAIFANTLIIFTYQSMGPIYILCGSLLVFSLQPYLNIHKKEREKENLLNSVLHSLKNRYNYDYGFLIKEKYKNTSSNFYGRLFFQPILNEGLYNYLMKLGFETEIMDYIVLLYEQSRNIIKNVDYISNNYNKLFDEKKLKEIEEINMDIHSLYCYYYVNIFELDELFNYKTKNIKILIGDLVDNNTSKDCLIIAKREKVYERLKEYNLVGNVVFK